MNARSSALGEIADVDRFFKVRLDENLHPPKSGWGEAAALMASPRRSGLVQPASQDCDMALLLPVQRNDRLCEQRHCVPSWRFIIAEVALK